jgi:adenylylsulfate kinase
MLIVLAGLPGTGKSTLALRLAARLPAAILDKDRIRAGLCPPDDVTYTADQDDFVMDVAYRTAEYLLRTEPDRAVTLDGRTFSKADQVADLLGWAARIGVPWKVIECACADAVAEERLTRDAAGHRHSATNRTAELYQSLKAQSDPLLLARLVIDTGTTDLMACVERAVAYLTEAD